jgi:DNA-binding IclR family transcriptional regulator
MQKLVNETEETVNLNVIYNGKRMSIKKIESPHDIRQAVTLGKMLPLYSGAPGKVLMAFLPSDKLEDYLKETELQLAGPNTITDRDELLQELEKIRKCRYAISREETYLGAFSIAAPVWDFSGNVTAALSVTGPVSRFSDDRIREFVPLVINAARSISVELGYQGDYLS